MKFSGTPLEHKAPPPTLGQHTEEVLRGLLKLDNAAIARLRSEGAI
jgi:crotonobetainyl-CoA:carnitine CoA-transferase CaiB-like acyl-CoA transferase